MRKQTFFILLFMVMLILLPEAIEAQGCSQCRIVPQSDLENGSKAARGINNAILYLMAFPYIFLIIFFRKPIINVFRNITARFRTSGR